MVQNLGLVNAGGFCTLSKTVNRTGRYPLVDGRSGEEIKGRIMRTLLDDEIRSAFLASEDFVCR